MEQFNEQGNSGKTLKNLNAALQIFHLWNEFLAATNETEISVTNICNSFQILILRLFLVILIFLVTVVCTTPLAMLIFLSYLRWLRN